MVRKTAEALVVEGGFRWVEGPHMQLHKQLENSTASSPANSGTWGKDSMWWMLTSIITCVKASSPKKKRTYIANDGAKLAPAHLFPSNLDTWSTLLGCIVGNLRGIMQVGSARTRTPSDKGRCVCTARAQHTCTAPICEGDCVSQERLQLAMSSSGIMTPTHDPGDNK